VIDWINNTIWNDLTAINTIVDYINNTIWTKISLINVTVGNISVNISTELRLLESNLTTLNNNIWSSINITDSVITYLNNTIWNEITAVNTTIDYLNNTIWTNLSLIDSDIDTLSVSVHTSLTASETNISNIIYNVWTSLNLTNATIDYLNASIWNEIDIINSNLNNTNLTITNMILLMENNITSLVITIENVIDYALMPDAQVICRNPPIVFSVFDRVGMMLGGSVWHVCPPINVIAQTRQEATGNWINSTPLIPSNGTVENGSITIMEDIIYFSIVNGTSPSWINITYTDNGTLIQNTTYLPARFYPEGFNVTINASCDIYTNRETRFNQLKKFYWDIYNGTDNPGWITESNGQKRAGYHRAGLEIENTMNTIWYDVYVYAGFSPTSEPDISTIRVTDVDNDNTILDEGENYKATTGIEFKLTGCLNISEARNFLCEYYKSFSEQYYYGSDIIHIDAHQTNKRHAGKLYNYFEYTWINRYPQTYRGTLSFYFDFEVETGIKQDEIIVYDSGLQRNVTNFIVSDQFLQIGGNAIGDVSPGGGKTYEVYFKFEVYPGQNVEDLHIATPLTNWGGIPISLFLVFVLIGLFLMIYGIFLMGSKNNRYKEHGKALTGIGLLIAVIVWILSALGV